MELDEFVIKDQLPTAGLPEDILYHTKMIIKLKKEIYVRGESGNLYTARFRIRERKAKNHYGIQKIHQYLYLTYRDGKKIKEIYITKLENKT